MLPSFVSLLFLSVWFQFYISSASRFVPAINNVNTSYSYSDPEIIQVLLGTISFQLVFSEGTFAIVFHFSLFLITSSHSVSD